MYINPKNLADRIIARNIHRPTREPLPRRVRLSIVGQATRGSPAHKLKTARHHR